MTAPNNHDGEKRRILVAEDAEMNQHLARHMIEAWGFEVDIAGNGREALVLVQENSYDSGVDGYTNAGNGWLWKQPGRYGN